MLSSSSVSSSTLVLACLLGMEVCRESQRRDCCCPRCRSAVPAHELFCWKKWLQRNLPPPKSTTSALKPPRSRPGEVEDEEHTRDALLFLRGQYGFLCVSFLSWVEDAARREWQMEALATGKASAELS
mmetsp:Transcript_34346/g.62830  ORF Transcript_34346/g.62830 Transcript_34346/m.62830 type:complete len:128 (-) Transcript_34346:95-478(-)